MKKEILFAIAIAFIVLVLSNAYVLYGLMQPKTGLSYLGRRVINSQDTYTYVSFVEQARQGRWLFENLYNSEDHTANLLRPSYILLGKMAAVFNVPSVFMYHIGRLMFSTIFFFVAWKFLGEFFESPRRKLLAFTILLTSCGLGFILGGFFPDASDLWVPESLTFLSLGEAPHFILSQALMLLSFLFILKAWKSGNKAFYILSGLSLVFLGFEHPFNLGVICLTVFIAGIYFWVTKKGPKKREIALGLGVVAIASFFAFFAQILELYTNPALRSWAEQNYLISPIPMFFILGYGFILFFAFLGLEGYLSQRKPNQILILSWIFSTCILLYSPIFFQRRFAEGAHIPLSILATLGVIEVARRISFYTIFQAKKIAYVSAICISVGVMGLGALGNVFIDITTLAHDNVNAYYYYLLDGEVTAMRYISDKTTGKDVILTNWFYGNILPGISGRKVFIGHKVQTPSFTQKIEMINEFLLTKDSDAAYKFLKKNKITYVYFGANDTMLEYGYNPDKKPYLIKVFEDDGATVYKVR